MGYLLPAYCRVKLFSFPGKAGANLGHVGALSMGWWRQGLTLGSKFQFFGTVVTGEGLGAGPCGQGWAVGTPEGPFLARALFPSLEPCREQKTLCTSIGGLSLPFSHSWSSLIPQLEPIPQLHASLTFPWMGCDLRLWHCVFDQFMNPWYKGRCFLEEPRALVSPHDVLLYVEWAVGCRGWG